MFIPSHVLNIKIIVKSYQSVFHGMIYNFSQSDSDIIKPIFEEKKVAADYNPIYCCLNLILVLSTNENFLTPGYLIITIMRHCSTHKCIIDNPNFNCLQYWITPFLFLLRPLYLSSPVLTWPSLPSPSPSPPS